MPVRESISCEQFSFAAHRTLLQLAFALGSIFSWVFAYAYFVFVSHDAVRALAGVVLLYALSRVVTLVLTPLSAAHLRRGTKQSLVFGTLLAGLAFSVMGASLNGYFDDPLGWGFVLFAVLIGMHRAVYWIPYRARIAHTHLSAHRWFLFLAALAPLFVGLTLLSAHDGATRIMFGASALSLLSLLPIVFVKDTKEAFSWGYADVFVQACKAHNARRLVRAVLGGAESMSIFLVWPLVVFWVVQYSFFIFGLALAASLMAMLALRPYRSKLLAHIGVARSRTVNAALAAAAWTLRLFVVGPLSVALVDSYAYATAPSGTASSAALSFEHSADDGAYVDEYSVLGEVGLALGGISMALLIIVLLGTLPFSAAIVTILLLAGVVATIAAAM